MSVRNLIVKSADILCELNANPILFSAGQIQYSAISKGSQDMAFPAQTRDVLRPQVYTPEDAGNPAIEVLE
jgi:hypothetical protein